MVSLETGHSEAISAEAIPRHLRATLSCLALLVALNPHQLKMGYESGRMREVKFSSEKTAFFAEPHATRSRIIFYDGIVSCPLYRFTYNSLSTHNSPLIESPLADVAPGSYTSFWLFTDIEHPTFPIEDSPLSLSHGISVVSANRLPLFVFLMSFCSSSSSFSSVCLFFSSLFIAFNLASLVLLMIKVSCEHLARVSPPLSRSFGPPAFYYQPYYPRDSPAAFTRFAMLPRFSFSFSLGRTIFYCVFTTKHNYYTNICLYYVALPRR